MGKRFTTINGLDFTQMVLAGAANLEANIGRVNGLNVFPVPDGDTGTNMNLTFSSGRDELVRRSSEHLGKTAEGLSKGLLMGARGNSGVILSQLFGGFAKSVLEQREIGPVQFAAALQQGVDTAYKAVAKPVEGTILTVAKEAARHAVTVARRMNDIGELMNEVLHAANQALARTPELLPVLKQVGVVDAGGQGLVCVYEGFVHALSGTAAVTPVPAAAVAPAKPVFEPHAAHGKSAQSMLATEDIEHGYCTEFMVRLVPGKTKGIAFDETRFRREMARFGDSLLVVADEQLVKIHIHAEYPGEVMNHAMKYGDLTRIKIENMREQHSHILEQDETVAHTPATAAVADSAERKPFGFVAISAGDGISDIFRSLRVDVVVTGGQTMNPSTEDIVKAIRQVPAETVFVLPNNSNIVLAAEQARKLLEDQTIVVIPTKTIPQGMAAMVAFNEKASTEANTEAMKRALTGVRSAQVTRSVRDTTLEGIEIREGDCLAISDGRIVAANPDMLETCRALLVSMLEDGGEIVTLYTGEEADEALTADIVAFLKSSYPDAEVEVQPGGQPVYPYLFSVE